MINNTVSWSFYRRGRRVLLQDERVAGGEETGRPSARHEGEEVEGRAQVEQNMGVHQGLAAGRPILSDVHMLGEL